MPLRPHHRLRLLATVSVLAMACGEPPVDLGPLRAQHAQLQREIDGLRESVSRLDAGESVFPESDVIIGVDQGLVERLLAVRLPYRDTIAPYDLVLDRVDVRFTGAPIIVLHGRVTRHGLLTMEGAATVMGSLTQIAVDGASGTLRAKVAVDYLRIERAAGIEALVSGSTLDEAAAAIQAHIQDSLPTLEIPIKVQQEFVLPSVHDGPVRLDGARLPVEAHVSRVLAAEGRLWVGLRLVVGLVGPS